MFKGTKAVILTNKSVSFLALSKDICSSKSQS